MNATTIQLWPAGRSVTYRGDYWAKTIEIQEGRGDEATWQAADEAMARAIRIEEMARTYQDRDILACQSCLISHLMDQGVDGFSFEDVTRNSPDPDDMDLDECKEWLDERGVSHPSVSQLPEEMDISTMTAQELLKELVEWGNSNWYDDEDMEQLANVMNNIDNCREELEGCFDDDDAILEAYREAVQNEIKHGDCIVEDNEIYEWWLVTDWLAKQLIEIGESVLDNDYGYWWGRGCTGQGMIMDGTLQAIAARHVR